MYRRHAASAHFTSRMQFDLEVRYTYRVDEPPATPEKVAGDQTGMKESRSSREEFKTFTFWVRLQLGMAAASSHG